MKQLERILFGQGGECFFCKQQLSKELASVEHLVALANGGRNDEDNCVVCCKQLNSLLGSKSIKGKLLVVLNQRGAFVCPTNADEPISSGPAAVPKTAPRVEAVKPKPAAKKAPRFVFTLADTKPPKVPTATKVSVSEARKSVHSTTSKDERFNLVVANLKQRGTSRPRTIKTLTSTVASLFPKGVSKTELAGLLKQLQTTGKVVQVGERVTYAL
jgi:HNH endonuclease